MARSLHRHAARPASTAAPKSRAPRNTPPSSTRPACLWQRRLIDDRQGPHRRDRHRATRCAVDGRDRRPHPREPAAHGATPTTPTRTTSRPDGSPFRPLYDDKIMFSGQPVALVVAEDCGDRALRGLAGARRIRARSRTSPICEPSAATTLADEPRHRRAEAARRCRRRPSPPPRCGTQAEYYVPIEHHNPMELFATTVIVGGRRQAHGLRQDAGRAERAALRRAACSA